MASLKSACNPIIVSAFDRRMTFSRTRIAATGYGVEERLLLVCDALLDDNTSSLVASDEITLDRWKHRSDMTGC